MQAIVQDRYGSTDVLALEDVAAPEIGERQVLVRVHAAGLDRGVWHLLAGLPYLIRPMYGLRRPRHRVPGQDVAGVVEAVGAAVTRFRPGDAVFGTCEGAFAELARAREDRLAHKPDGITFEQAAAIPISGCAALQALRDQGRVRAGQSVLVLGASGGVGTFAVQLAKDLGAVVTAVCSASKADLVRTLGADHVVDYEREGQPGGRYDVVLDIGGNRSLTQLRRLLAPRGTLVFVGGEAGGRWLGGTGRWLLATLLSPFVRQRLRVQVSKEVPPDLEHLAGLVTSGAIAAVLDRTYPLAEVPKAIAYLEDGHVRGKVVITV